MVQFRDFFFALRLPHRFKWSSVTTSTDYLQLSLTPLSERIESAIDRIPPEDFLEIFWRDLKGSPTAVAASLFWVYFFIHIGLPMVWSRDFFFVHLISKWSSVTTWKDHLPLTLSPFSESIFSFILIFPWSVNEIHSATSTSFLKKSSGTTSRYHLRQSLSLFSESIFSIYLDSSHCPSSIFLFRTVLSPPSEVTSKYFLQLCSQISLDLSLPIVR